MKRKTKAQREDEAKAALPSAIWVRDGGYMVGLKAAALKTEEDGSVRYVRADIADRLRAALAELMEAAADLENAKIAQLNRVGTMNCYDEWTYAASQRLDAAEAAARAVLAGEGKSS